MKFIWVQAKVSATYNQEINLISAMRVGVLYKCKCIFLEFKIKLSVDIGSISSWRREEATSLLQKKGLWN
jgi:hypothetical protein